MRIYKLTFRERMEIEEEEVLRDRLRKADMVENEVE